MLRRASPIATGRKARFALRNLQLGFLLANPARANIEDRCDADEHNKT